MSWQDEGQEPDYRFTLANERTFLAWIRTGLAVLAGAVLLHQFATRIEPAWARPVLGGALALLAALLGGGAYHRWKQLQIAMRHSRPLPASLLMPLLSACLVALCVALALVIVRP